MDFERGGELPIGFSSDLTYLFWSPTKTINVLRYSWLIDIKSVRNISGDVVVSYRQILPS
jgi:hypothetical protein